MPVSRSLLSIWTIICYLIVSIVADGHLQTVNTTQNPDITYQLVPIIRIESDGVTCPPGFTSTPRQNVPGVGLTCTDDARQLAGNTTVTETTATCCVTVDQLVFLVSIVGLTTPRPNARYLLDAKTCCYNNETQADMILSQCKYGLTTFLSVQSPELTQCCWNTTASDFNVHLRDYSVGLIQPMNNDTTISTGNLLCPTLNVKMTMNVIRASYVQVAVNATLTCTLFGTRSDIETMSVRYDHHPSEAGKLEFDFGVGTVFGTVNSQLIETSPGSKHWIVKMSGVAHGTGVFLLVVQPLEFTVPNHPVLDSYMNLNEVC